MDPKPRGDEYAVGVFLVAVGHSADWCNHSRRLGIVGSSRIDDDSCRPMDHKIEIAIANTGIVVVAETRNP